MERDFLKLSYIYIYVYKYIYKYIYNKMFLTVSMKTFLNVHFWECVLVKSICACESVYTRERERGRERESRSLHIYICISCKRFLQ